jgi:hypothetical protein
MSVYGFLNCHDCRQNFWLGKAIGEGGHERTLRYHIGDGELPNWKRESLNQVLWKFMADHTGHRIDVRLEWDMTDEMYGYQNIDGDGEGDISIEEYLGGWQ